MLRLFLGGLDRMHCKSPEWVRDAVFYQIFPDRFAISSGAPKPSQLEPWDAPPTLYGFKGGDLDGVRERLPYLADLGVNALYLCPVFASTANHRYHTYDYFQVDPILGGNAALRRLLDACHARGMRLILDGVFNHASRGFYQFAHTLENGIHSPYVDWFHFNRDWLQTGRPLNAFGITAPRFEAPADEGSLDKYGYRAWWDIPALPKFNTGHPEVRAFLFSVAEHWMRFGIDGWRLDVPNEIDDDAFWREFRTRVKAVRPDAYIVGEIWEDARRWLQGDQFDGVMNYVYGKAILGFCLGPQLNRAEMDKSGYRDVRPLSAEACAAVLTDLLAAYPPETAACQLNLVDSHDTPRLLTLASGDDAGIRLVLTLLFTFVGAPCLYYGDEVGMPGGHDPDCRRGMEWDEALWHTGVLAHVKACIALRHRSVALRHGDCRVLHASSGVLVLSRSAGAATAVIVINTSEQPADVIVAGPGGRVVRHERGLEHVPGSTLAPLSDGRLALRDVLPRSGQVWLLDGSDAGEG